MKRSRPHSSRRGARRATPGALPGTLTAQVDAKPSRIVVRQFNPATFRETELTNTADIGSLLDPSLHLWVEVTGLGDAEAIAAIGRAFGLHELLLEDVLDPGQRAKVEHYDDYTFVVLKSLVLNGNLESHHISLFIGQRFVITLRDVDRPSLAPVRERLRHARGKIRERAPDYLAYALIDTLIDHHYPVIEAFDDELERIEDAVLEAQGKDPIDLARRARQDLQTIRHAVWPARDVITLLMRDDVSSISDETRLHLRDVYDHVVQLQEMIEYSREIAASLLESYISRVSLRANEIMKVLTVIATIFIPLTFITGVYGMNFRRQASPFNMPELDWYYGYPLALLFMLVIALACLFFFRGKGWFDGGKG